MFVICNFYIKKCTFNCKQKIINRQISLFANRNMTSQENRKKNVFYSPIHVHGSAPSDQTLFRFPPEIVYIEEVYHRNTSICELNVSLYVDIPE